MGKRKVGALDKLDADLASLQYKIRRDPTSYQEEFQNQYFQYETFRELFMRAPSTADEGGIVSLRDLIDFISHVADCYPTVTAGFPEDLINLITLHHAELGSELRDKIVSSLTLLRKKGVIDSSTLLQTLFPILITTPSKALRALLYQRIVSDLRSANSKSTDHRLNRTFQTVLFNLITSDRASPKSIWAVKITRELWRRRVWQDSKAVEIMKEAALADNEKVILGGVRFFLGGDKEREEAADESSDEEEVDLDRIRHQVGINKKSRKKEKELKRVAATVKKKERKKHQPHPLNFSALHLLHDPQTFAETLFTKFLQNVKCKLHLEQKLLVLQLVSRLVGLHKLILIGLYQYILKYIHPRQISVTSFLASLAQATHQLVPPDELEPLLQKIANEFVSEAAASEVAAAGLNAIREVCARQPLAMNETLLQDLVAYRKSKDKGVMMAARGLLSLYREVGADLLKKRDRGREAALGLRAGRQTKLRFGEEVAGEIEGLELLEKWKEEEIHQKNGKRSHDNDEQDSQSEDEPDSSEDDWKAWEVEENDSDNDSGGWIDVSSEGEAIDISDSDSEKERPTKKRKGQADSTTKNPVEESHEGDAQVPEPKPSLATRKILTPADFAKLNELRTQASVSAMLPAARRQNLARRTQSQADPEAVTATNIEAPAALSARATKEQKIASAKADQTEKHMGRAARRQDRKRAAGKSSTNKEKERKKNFLMRLGKARGKMNGKANGSKGSNGKNGGRKGRH